MISRGLCIPTGIRIEITMTFYQQKTGHEHDEAHSVKMDKSNSTSYNCGAKQTRSDLFLSCTLVQRKANEAQGNAGGTYCALLAPAHEEDIAAMACFLEITKIVTRRRPLEL